MKKTNLFEWKHLKACYALKRFLKSKGMEITIYSDYIIVGKLDTEPTEFLYLQYPESEGIELLIEYWMEINNINSFHENS